MEDEKQPVNTRLNPSCRKAALVSLHFSPAFVSHMIAYGKLLAELGFAVSFVLHERYLSFADFSAAAKAGFNIIRAGAPESLDCDIAIFANAALGNSQLAKKMRARGSSVFYVFNEPGSIWNYFSEDLWQILKFPIATICSIAMLRHSSGVLVPSLRAEAQYERYFRKYNRNVHSLPLLFDDEVSEDSVDDSRRRKRLFTFTGGAGKAHGFEAFIAFAKHAIRSGSTIPFAVATRTNLSHLLLGDKELAGYVRSGQIAIQHGHVLSNDEINRCCLESFCVWNVYLHSTQSGVLPRAFMAGSPVLASPIGSFPEYVREGQTGEFVDPAGDPAEILEIAERMRKAAPSYVNHCRRAFLETFYYRANSSRLATILAATCPGLFDSGTVPSTANEMNSQAHAAGMRTKESAPSAGPGEESLEVCG